MAERLPKVPVQLRSAFCEACHLTPPPAPGEELTHSRYESKPGGQGSVTRSRCFPGEMIPEGFLRK